MRAMYKYLISVAMSAVSVVYSADTNSALQSVVQSSDAVVIAHIDEASFDGTLHQVQLRVLVPLKGSLSSGAAFAADFAPSGQKGGSVSGAPKDDVLLAMSQDGRGLWHLSPISSSGLGLAAAYFRIPDQVVAAASPLNGTPEAKVAQLVTSAVEAGAADAPRLEKFVRYSDAPDRIDLWSRSSSPRLRAYGLTKRVAAQDASAVASIGTALGGVARTDAMLLFSSLLGYRNTDPNGVRALGQLATTSGADAQLVTNCAYALEAIHTRESVPYLARLLDSPDRNVRELAVMGLSSFVTNMRAAKDGIDTDLARDEVLNPGKRKSLPRSDAPFETAETRAFLHFGPFGSVAEETSVIAFWKGWFQQNQAQF